MKILKLDKNRRNMLIAGLVGLALGYVGKDQINLILGAIRPPSTALGERWYSR